MSALTEKVAREHGAYRFRAYVVCKGCKARTKAPHLLAAEDWWRLHIANVTEAATRAAVAADIRADPAQVVHGELNAFAERAARIAEGKQP